MSAEKIDAVVDSLVSLLKSEETAAPRPTQEEGRRQVKAIRREVSEEEHLTEIQDKNMSFLLRELSRQLARGGSDKVILSTGKEVEGGSTKEIA